ncbi:Kunitz type trypsin inhibitor / miraculin, partial [Quillaja saponaria]
HSSQNTRTAFYTRLETIKSIALLAVSFLLFAFTAFARSDPVFDISGDIVQEGVSYHILPVHRGRGGGFTLANTGDKQSGPLDVIQQHVRAFDSLPLAFSPLIQRRGEVHISNDLNIKVSAKTSSEQSRVWKVAKQSNGLWFVTTCGVEGNLGFETITSWFKIEKYGSDYKLAFCPEVVDAPVICKDLGIYVDEEGKRHLALGDEIPPLTVMFKRAETSSKYLETVV